jgi:hypothetical protein
MGINIIKLPDKTGFGLSLKKQSNLAVIFQSIIWDVRQDCLFLYKWMKTTRLVGCQHKIPKQQIERASQQQSIHFGAY